ncbi:hypothetical protein GGR53DRAFT_464487 [Hypoxylon sp. FL1150]|nr:hypothetical protein GGR53DRAFT_464487 [Hypoxylon sp. FL1150]
MEWLRNRSLEACLKGRIKTMEEVLTITGQPGISINVIHQGTELLGYGMGFADLKSSGKRSKATRHTASEPRAFMTASLDLLVQEEQFSWDGTVGNSPSVMLYGHQGDVPGYMFSLYITPEIQSALVVLFNETGLSDATD